jgi:hypothetical protein
MTNYTVLWMALAFGLVFGVPALIGVWLQRRDSK